MTTLFDPLQTGKFSLANRVAMAPCTRNRSPGGVPVALNAEYYAQRAEMGLLITEGTAITAQGQGYAHVPGLYTPEQLAGWQKVTRAVHERGGCIVTQLWHVGRVSHTSLQPDCAAPVAPSAITAQARTFILDAGSGQGHFAPTSPPRALASHELPALVQDFARAARAAVQEAGFDGVELHGANGYLLDQFLKDGANQRSDDYGGSIAARMRFMLEVVQAVAAAVGGGRVGIRLSPVTPANDIHDSQPQPLFEQLARSLAPLSLAYIHVIEGATGGARELAERPFDYAALKAAYRDAGGRGAWMVNNGYTRAMAMEAVASGRADIVAFGRDAIANPDLVRRLRLGAALNPWDKSSFYGGGARGYTDYPALPA
ncbi:alkene reductase [Comamonas sp. NLF-1-9]|uniref:alkene reductase n=1 Tax=Comamonas sp. NLF-1-9 TaxID=2853163 RepID=UPI001C475E32|nr:alkene reductase [Comamonas sp. NLF-1-9]QXL83867.1 alkene reductase [Comamonas sp. NLF-1-9]